MTNFTTASTSLSSSRAGHVARERVRRYRVHALPPPLSRRVLSLENEGAYAVLNAALELEKAGQSITHLELGQPSFGTPQHVRDAAVAAITAGRSGYAPPAGTANLRSAIAQKVSHRRGWAGVDACNVVVGPGAKPPLFLALMALLDIERNASEVLAPDPGFPSYANSIKALGGDIRAYDASRVDTIEDLVTSKTRVIIVNSPSNPTGAVLDDDDVNRIAEIAMKHNLYVISDEIYSELMYDDASLSSSPRCPSPRDIAGMENRTIVVDGFSKTYCMTGWRLGYGIMPSEIADAVELLSVHSLGCTASFTQEAGVQALTCADSDHAITMMREEYRKRRDYVVHALNAMNGVTCETPRGAFYAFPNIEALGLSSKELAHRLLYDAGVAMLPGTDFGERGEGHLRISYVSSLSELEQGLEKMRNLVERL